MELSAGQVVLYGVLASTAAGLATGVGALPCLFLKGIPQRLMDILLGGAAGVMLAATAFSLITPAIEYGTRPEIYDSNLVAVGVVMAGILIGALFLDRADKWLPHEHFIMGPEGPSSSLRRVWLFVFAITLHNFPEGLAVGVGFGGGTTESVRNGTALAIGIGLQNMPEGLAVALPLMREGYGRWYALAIGTASGLVEPIGGLLGAAMVSVMGKFLPLGMAFAAGAMLFVISDEIIPETHRKGHARAATFGVIIGFIIMMALDNLFG